MSQTLEDRIKDLERELALKQAYLSVQFTFPKTTKLPEDVRTQVVEELKKACAQLAEDKEATVAEMNPNSTSYLSQEEMQILKDLAQTVKAKMTKPSTPAPTPTKQPVQEDYDSVKQAVLLTLENVPQNVRVRMGSNETVYVKSQKDGLAFIVTRTGIGIKVPVEDLDFNL